MAASAPTRANDIINPPTAVAGGGEQITFDTIATDGLDGLDFGVDLEPVEFDLRIDGTAYPSLVFFPSSDAGGRDRQPGDHPVRSDDQLNRRSGRSRSPQWTIAIELQ